MTIVFQQITSTSEVDLDGLFDSSFPDIDQNFFSQTTITDPAEKKAFYFGQLQDAINGTSYLQKPGDRFFMFKGSIDGVDCIFNAGFIDLDNSYRGHWYLTRPINNSKAWIFTSETTTIRSDFFKAIGVESFKAMGHANSNVISALLRNPNITILKEESINNGTSTELTIQV